MKSEHIYKSHNKTLLLYHLVFPAKYRKEVFDESVDNTLKEICENGEDRCGQVGFMGIQ
jgi:putative transposase